MRRRAGDNLALLARQCDGTPAALGLRRGRAAAGRRWPRSSSAALDRAALARIDAAPRALLAAAERLTQALQSAAGRRALHIVNLCGRQRMRVQRIAKEQPAGARWRAAGAGASPRRHAAACSTSSRRAARARGRRRSARPTIRAALAQVREDWLRLVAGLRTARRDAGRARDGARERDAARAPGRAHAGLRAQPAGDHGLSAGHAGELAREVDGIAGFGPHADRNNA